MGAITLVAPILTPQSLKCVYATQQPAAAASALVELEEEIASPRRLTTWKTEFEANLEVVD